MTDDLLRAALEYAAHGWPIFPTRKDKAPYTQNGVLDASTNPDQIREWWSKTPRAGIGLDVGGAGMMVLDLDPGHSMEQIEDNIGPLPKTRLEQSTPRGGRHLFYALAPGEVVPPSTSKIAPHVDIRSFHSYVVLAPTQDYAWAGDWSGKPAHRSDEMFARANTHRAKAEDRDTWVIAPDLPENVEAATRWLKNDAQTATAGRGGEMMTYRTGAMLKSFGISEGLAFELAWDVWNPRNNPPWTADESDHFAARIERAYRYNTSPPGNMTEAYHQAKRKDLFKPVREKTAEGYASRGRFRFIDRDAMEHVTPPPWLIEDCLPERSVGLLYGFWGSYKTFVALDMALSLVTGPETFPARPQARMWTPLKRGRVLFSAGEGRDSLIKRVRGWEEVHNGGKRIDNFLLTDPVPRAVDENEWETFVDEARDYFPDGVDLLVLDTVSRAMHGLDENATKDAGAFTRMCQFFRDELGCCVLGIAHTGADRSKVRGSSAFESDADVVIRADAEGDLAKLTMVKQKDADTWEKPRLAHLKLNDVDGFQTLVAVPYSEASASRDTPFAVLKSDRESLLTALDAIVTDVLKANKAKGWSNKDLAEAVAMDDRCEYSSSSLVQTRKSGVNLVTLREHKAMRSNSFYAPEQRRWRYRDAPKKKEATR